MTDPKFRTKAGRLTPYSFACGYVEQIDTPDMRLSMWNEGTYHVRAHDFKNGARIFWECFETLGEARKRYDAAKRELSIH